MPALVDVLEVAFVLLLLAGVGLMSVPAALVLAGLAGVVACERASSRRAAQGRRGREGGER